MLTLPADLVDDPEIDAVYIGVSRMPGVVYSCLTADVGLAVATEQPALRVDDEGLRSR